MRLLHLFWFVLLTQFIFGQNTPYYKLVNPFIGTGGHGHTYPGVTMPFGAVQVSPDSRLDGWDGCGGYHYTDSVIYGFSHTHLSGTGVSDYGDLLLMPFTGATEWESGYPDNEGGYGASFKHSQEQAYAGSYRVFLEEDEIQVDLAATTHCAMHRYTYPKWQKKKVIIDLSHRDQLLDSDLILLNDSTLIGKRISKAWATEQHFYFTIRFSEAVVNTQMRKDKTGKPSQFVMEFGHVKEQLLVKVGISAVDINGAKNNLKVEMPHWEFETYQKACEEAWNDELGKIAISTTNKNEEITFYTALYHSFLNPNTFSDVDGRYRGMDQQIHQDKNRNQYTIFSLWDTFRATHPLFTITQQKRTEDFIATFLAQYRQGGILPIWELSANYTGCMIGYHAIPVITDAYVKGIRNFDTDLALKAMCHSADQNHLGLESYKKRGYISAEDESESVSKTLEYAYDDWCIAVFADSLGEDSIAAVYYERAQYYQNIFNLETQFMQPRLNGGWKNTFKPDEVTFDYTEANSWQYSMFAPHDVDGLIELLGGRDSLANWLDRLFTASSETSGRHQVDITGLIGQYAHGNEPSHHMAYLYNFTPEAYKTQSYVHQILTTLYSNTPDGLSGNEDCGQMSSWYVLSSLGFYSFAPGSDVYLTGTPLFDSAAIHLENNKTFTIKRTQYRQGNFYVKSITLNGVELNRNYIYQHEILAGGELVFEMSPTPIFQRTDYLTSAVAGSRLVASPYFKDATPSFHKKRKLAIASNTHRPVEIFYTLDGSAPSRASRPYKKPIKLKETTTVKARAYEGQQASYPIEGTFHRANADWDIRINSPYANQYAASGNNALIDQLKGTHDFRTGAWQGYFAKDMDIELDFGKQKKISAISVRFLQDIKSWIWAPAEVRFLISKNGKDWFTAHTIKSKTPIDQYGAFVANYALQKSFKTRYLKIVAKNVGPCPDWHLGAGNPTWLFADEIEIR